MHGEREEGGKCICICARVSMRWRTIKCKIFRLRQYPHPDLRLRQTNNIEQYNILFCLAFDVVNGWTNIIRNNYR